MIVVEELKLLIFTICNNKIHKRSCLPFMLLMATMIMLSQNSSHVFDFYMDCIKESRVSDGKEKLGLGSIFINRV